MTYFSVALDLEIFNQLLEYAPEALVRKAREDARRMVGPCFTELTLQVRCEEHSAWESLSELARERVIESLLVNEYEHISEMASDAIDEEVKQHLDEPSSWELPPEGGCSRLLFRVL